MDTSGSVHGPLMMKGPVEGIHGNFENNYEKDIEGG
jgi:hypothetical protein